MNNILFDKKGYYALIGVFKDKDYSHFSLILDTNTTINLEKFYFNPHKLEKYKLDATVEFLIDNCERDPIPGFGMQEACWDYSISSLNIGQYNKMEKALTEVLNWDKEQILRHSKSSGVPYENKAFRKIPEELMTLTNQFDANPLMIGSYACVLKIMILQKMHHVSKFNRIKEFLRFVNQDLFANHAIELNIAINYFLGTSKMQEIGDKIFKFGKTKNVILNAWNTCWDLFFLRLLQRTFFEDVQYAIKAKLITADQGIINLASMCSLETVIKDDDNYISILSFCNNDIREEYLSDVEKIERDMYFSSVERRMKLDNVIDMQKHLRNIVISLEKDLINT